MTLSPEHLTQLRTYLKEFKASSMDEANKEAAETVNNLIPALIDSIKDEELDHIMSDTWSYILFQLITQASQPQEPSPDTPLVSLN